MIEFYIRYADFNLFRQGEPVAFVQEITSFSAWRTGTPHHDTSTNDWLPELVIKLSMPIDEVEFVATSERGRANIKRGCPLKGNTTKNMSSRHRSKVKNGH